MLASFLSPETTSLKICGVTLHSDAIRLADLGVHALGVNFWPQSKRYLDPATAGWLADLAGRILRVAVVVNAGPDLPLRLFHDGLIDLVQLHGDETPHHAAPLREAGLPFIKAFGVKSPADLELATEFGAAAILLDAHAPGIHGGTGKTIDWSLAASFRASHPALPLILAGGITPKNAAAAIQSVHPAAIDIASGAESAPGIKDFSKVAALAAAVARGYP